MTTHDLFRCIGDLSDEFIEEAAEIRRKSRWLPIAALAACCLIAVGLARLVTLGMGNTSDSTAALDAAAPETAMMQATEDAKSGSAENGALKSEGADDMMDAAANDAVFNEVPEEVVKELGVFEVRTKCSNKNEMLLRPDWGREFLPDARQKIAENCVHHPQVQIYFGDGLCSPSIKANIPDLFPTIKMGLEDKGITVGTPFFVRYCRVNTARTIGPLLDAEVTCVLIGERPGLLTSESMSAYIAYHARPDMLESEYTVVSNISRHGVPPVEAAAHIADLIAQILEKKKSGVEFSKAE